MRFTREQKLIHHLVLHSHDTPYAFGLLKGKMGIALALAHYARIRNNNYIDKVADFLMEQITDNLTKNEDIGFANGLSGIGWGIEFLIQNGYMDGNSLEICEEIDRRIMSSDIRRMQDMSFDTGIKGLMKYVLAHLQGGLKNGSVPFDTVYLNDWIGRLRVLCEEQPGDPVWKEGLTQLNMLLNERKGNQTLVLKPLIKPMRKCPIKVLGLQDGLAGYIESKLIYNEYEAT